MSPDPDAYRERDEWTPRDRGLTAGSIWAQGVRNNQMTATDAEGEEIDLLAEAAKDPPRIPDSVRGLVIDAGVRERLDASEDPNAESAFWAGFGRGVRAYLVKAAIGTDN